jgi:enoyl-CoA hydratase
MPYYTPGGEGAWRATSPKEWMSIWDLAKPVIAQVHGYCLAEASELATGCDLVYIGRRRRWGIPQFAWCARHALPPWFLGMRKAMEMMLTGDSISGIEAAGARLGDAAYPEAELEDRVLEVAERIDGADRAAAAQQARRASPDGRDGLRRHPRRYRAPRWARTRRDARLHRGLRAASRPRWRRGAPFGDYRTAG